MKSLRNIGSAFLMILLVLWGCSKREKSEKLQNPFIKFNRQINALNQKLEDADFEKEEKEVEVQLKKVEKAKQAVIDKMKLPHKQKIEECKEILKNAEGKSVTKIKMKLTAAEDEIEYINYLASEELKPVKSYDDDE